MSVRLRNAAGIAVGLLLAGCVTRTPPPAPPVVVPVPTPAPLPTPAPAPIVTNARLSGVRLVAPARVDPVQAARALGAFRISCPSLVRRSDSSGLTNPADWQSLCAEAASVDPAAAPVFFRDRFDWVVVGPGEAFATGYYEPEIRGSRIAALGVTTPIYRTPPDLVRCTRADGGTGRGRIDQSGQCVYYFTRAEIE
ncbi:MAG: MltA domain-containing protein, partial [Sphingomonas sp.]|nr:MltA domain-containing protein [Sphingomonas sp.]